MQTVWLVGFTERGVAMQSQLIDVEDLGNGIKRTLSVRPFRSEERFTNPYTRLAGVVYQFGIEASFE